MVLQVAADIASVGKAAYPRLLQGNDTQMPDRMRMSGVDMAPPQRTIWSAEALWSRPRTPRSRP